MRKFNADNCSARDTVSSKINNRQQPEGHGLELDYPHQGLERHHQALMNPQQGLERHH